MRTVPPHPLLGAREDHVLTVRMHRHMITRPSAIARVVEIFAAHE